LVSREDVQKIIEEQKVPELQMVELSLLMKQADRGNKGYIVIEKFIERLQELASETKQEVVLKNFALSCKRQTLSLKQELMKFDSKREDRLDKRTFMKAIGQLPMPLNDEQVEQLYLAGESAEYHGYLDIKQFIDKVAAAAKYTPLQVPSTLTQ